MNTRIILPGSILKSCFLSVFFYVLFHSICVLFKNLKILIDTAPDCQYLCGNGLSKMKSLHHYGGQQRKPKSKASTTVKPSRKSQCFTIMASISPPPSKFCLYILMETKLHWEAYLQGPLRNANFSFKASAVENNGFQSMGYNLLVGHDINLMSHKWHFKKWNRTEYMLSVCLTGINIVKVLGTHTYICKEGGGKENKKENIKKFFYCGSWSRKFEGQGTRKVKRYCVPIHHMS